jgi:hypothetical protein
VWCPGQNKRIAPLCSFHGCRTLRINSIPNWDGLHSGGDGLTTCHVCSRFLIAHFGRLREISETPLLPLRRSSVSSMYVCFRQIAVTENENERVVGRWLCHRRFGTHTGPNLLVAPDSSLCATKAWKGPRWRLYGNVTFINIYSTQCNLSSQLTIHTLGKRVFVVGRHYRGLQPYTGNSLTG